MDPAQLNKIELKTGLKSKKEDDEGMRCQRRKRQRISGEGNEVKELKNRRGADSLEKHWETGQG